MVIDVADMGYVGLEFGDHRPNPSPGFARINRLCRKHPFMEPSTRLLEVDVWHEVTIVGSGQPSGVGHGKQRCLMTFGAQKLHGLEQVDLGSAEGIVIFVAKQNLHGNSSNPELRPAGLRPVAGTSLQNESGFSCG